MSRVSAGWLLVSVRLNVKYLSIVSYKATLVFVPFLAQKKLLLNLFVLPYSKI